MQSLQGIGATTQIQKIKFWTMIATQKKNLLFCNNK